MNFQRSEEEWLAVCDKITRGHCAPGDNSGPQATYWEAKSMRPLICVPPHPRDHVFDLGCGNGRLAMALILHGFENVRYIGVDPVPESIEFCREAFRPWPNFEFIHVPLKTPTYTPNQSCDPLTCAVRLPLESVVWAAALSVFTHLHTDALAAHYVEEFRRVLKPGGVLWSTWFRSPPNVSTPIVERTVYLEAWIVNALRGFHWEATWGGSGTTQHDQWNIFARKI